MFNFPTLNKYNTFFRGYETVENIRDSFKVFKNNIFSFNKELFLLKEKRSRAIEFNKKHKWNNRVKKKFIERLPYPPSVTVLLSFLLKKRNKTSSKRLKNKLLFFVNKKDLMKKKKIKKKYKQPGITAKVKYEQPEENLNAIYNTFDKNTKFLGLDTDMSIVTDNPNQINLQETSVNDQINK